VEKGLGLINRDSHFADVVLADFVFDTSEKTSIEKYYIDPFSPIVPMCLN